MITNLFAWRPESPLCEECETELDYLPITGTHFMFHCWACGRCYKPVVREEAARYREARRQEALPERKMTIGQPNEVEDPYVLFENCRYGRVIELRVGSVENDGRSVRVGPPLCFEISTEDEE